MHFVVLAAGNGSRLGLGMPKVLVELSDGVSLMKRHLRAFRAAAGDAPITVVAGFRAEAVAAAATGCHIVLNTDFPATNTARSLAIALADIDDDVVMINGDVFCHADAVRRTMEAPGTSIGVRYGPTGEEEVKFASHGGRVTALSKSVLAAEGEAVGLNRLGRDELTMLKGALERCRPTDYFERAIEAICTTVMVGVTDLTHFDCVEIDFPEDLARANAIIDAVRAKADVAPLAREMQS